MYTISTCMSQISVRETYHVMHWVEINSVDSVTQNAGTFCRIVLCTRKKFKAIKHLQITSLPSLTVPSSVKRTFPAEIKGKIYKCRQLILFTQHNASILKIYNKPCIN